MRPPAGYGIVAVQGGNGHEHVEGEVVFEESCPLAGVPNVETHTNNSAELLGFCRALQWAANSAYTSDPEIPVCLRYDSCYAAMISSLTWKPKAHAALAREARLAWRLLKKRKGERLWLRHVRGHSGHRWNDTADSLANAGRKGVKRKKEAPIRVD